MHMITWHIVSLASILVELLLFLKVRMYQLGMILIIVTGLLLAALGMWIGGDESFASAPIIPCFMAFTVLVVKEIRRNHSFANRNNPYCSNSKMSPMLRFVLLGLAIVCAVIKLVSMFLER